MCSVSGLHARLEARGDEVLVTDLDSTNGTFIDDQRIRPGDAVAVGAGAVITFGEYAKKLLKKQVKKVMTHWDWVTTGNSTQRTPGGLRQRFNKYWLTLLTRIQGKHASR